MKRLVYKTINSTYVYHGTHSADAVLSILARGFNTSGVCLTDSLYHAEGYGKYIIRAKAADIFSRLNIYFVNDAYSFKLEDYPPDCDGLCERLHADPSKLIYYISNVAKLNTLHGWEYMGTDPSIQLRIDQLTGKPKQVELEEGKKLAEAARSTINRDIQHICASLQSKGYSCTAKLNLSQSAIYSDLIDVAVDIKYKWTNIQLRLAYELQNDEWHLSTYIEYKVDELINYINDMA